MVAIDSLVIIPLVHTGVRHCYIKTDVGFLGVMIVGVERDIHLAMGSRGLRLALRIIMENIDSIENIQKEYIGK